MQPLDPRTTFTSRAVLDAKESPFDKNKSAHITDLAREVAAEFSETTYAPGIVRGLFQLTDFIILTLPWNLISLDDGGRSDRRYASASPVLYSWSIPV